MLCDKETEVTDEDIRALWRSKGGKFHGPHIETGTMPEAQLLPFLRELLTLPEKAMLVQPDVIKAGGQYPENVWKSAQRLAYKLGNMTPSDAG